MAQELQIILHLSIGILDGHGPVSCSVESRETFLTLNETGKIISDKPIRFFRQLVATTKGNVIAEVVELRGERVNLDRNGAMRERPIWRRVNHVAEW